MILQEGSAYMAGLTPLSTRNGQLRAFMQGSSELFVFRWKMLLLTRIRNTIQETSTRGKSGLGQGSAPPGNSFDSQASRPMRKSPGVSVRPREQRNGGRSREGNRSPKWVRKAARLARNFPRFVSRRCQTVQGGSRRFMIAMVDLVGIEPTTSSMPWKRAPSCATGPLEGTNAADDAQPHGPIFSQLPA